VDLERESSSSSSSSSSREFGGPPGVDNSILMAGGGGRAAAGRDRDIAQGGWYNIECNENNDEMTMRVVMGDGLYVMGDTVVVGEHVQREISCVRYVS
jgi:hypothetical protein